VTDLDPNLHPWRPDLAASHLRGRVEAARYADPVAYQVTAGVAPLRQAPQPDAEQLSQALHGAVIDIYEEQGEFGWGQMRLDGYVGWFAMEALSAPVLPVTRRVRALRTYAYAEPSSKAAPRFLLSLNAEVAPTGEEVDGFVACARCGWVAREHLAALYDFEPDPVAVALRFVGAPYQWGGVESLGLDCSGLVQTAYRACGFALPRDSYMQRDAGREVSDGQDLSGLRRGDVIVWRQHVALVVDPQTVVHANTFHMATALEPLHQALTRVATRYGPVVSVRRFLAE
jgi:cell wall-associated NlpC family hydrolase